MEKQRFSFVGTGSAFLLVIFTVLCLVTFAALSLVSATTDQKLATATEATTTAYYAASNQANRRLASLDNALAALAPGTGSQAAFASGVPGVLPEGWTWDSAAGKATTQITIKENQNLVVSVQPTFPQNPGETYYTVTQWQVVNTQSWQQQDTLNVIK